MTNQHESATPRRKSYRTPAAPTVIADAADAKNGPVNSYFDGSGYTSAPV